MNFFNSEVNLAYLPAAETVQWQPVNKRYLSVLRLTWLFTCLFLLLGVSAIIFFSPRVSLPGNGLYLLGGWLFVATTWRVIQERSFASRAYAIREHDILYKHGWIVEENHACPFNRVQHCSVHSGPLERKYGLASLTLNTAGSGDADLKISGLPEAAAHDIRAFILKKIAPDAE